MYLDVFLIERQRGGSKQLHLPSCERFSPKEQQQRLGLVSTQMLRVPRLLLALNLGVHTRIPPGVKFHPLGLTPGSAGHRGFITPPGSHDQVGPRMSTDLPDTFSTSREEGTVVTKPAFPSSFKVSASQARWPMTRNSQVCGWSPMACLLASKQLPALWAKPTELRGSHGRSHVSAAHPRQSPYGLEDRTRCARLHRFLRCIRSSHSI